MMVGYMILQSIPVVYVQVNGCLYFCNQWNEHIVYGGCNWLY